MPEEITLTREELEEIKSTERFREKTTLTLKRLTTKLDNGFFNKVEKLEVHKNIHWFLISVVLLGIISLAFAMIKRGG